MAPLPSQIGRYEIKSLIGRGGMGDLYLAHDPNTSRLVALKLLNATLDSSELRERFAREARALAALNHPNIVNIYDTGEYDDAPFIVMEYVRGETLAEIIKRRAPLSVSQKLKLLMELCAGLAQAHNADIVHRDIKPANLMVDQQGRLKILDFGIARVTEDNRTRVGPLTQVNMMIGTPGYMSPEQLEAGEVDHRSDIFAVGAVCYELLSYTEAFAGSDTRMIERRVLAGKPVPLASLVPGLDPEIDEIIQRALKKDPNKRYQDAATFEKALDRVRARIGADAPQDLPRPTPPSPQSAGGKSRAVRAEAAYQRALGAAQSSSREAARRFAVEALAEDPSHAGARSFLAGLDNRSPLPSPQSAPPRRPAFSSGETSVGETQIGTSAGHAMSTSVGGAIGTSAGRTAVGPSRTEATSSFDSAPTIIVSPSPAKSARPPAKPPGGRNRIQALWDRATKAGPETKAYVPKAAAQKGKPGAGAGSTRRQEPLWLRYRWAAVGLGVSLLIALIAAVLFFGRPGSGNQLLTITKPVGGTLSAAGIRCGTRGSDCSASRPNGDPIELTPVADAGFTFAGYTGDCAPGGRTIMTTPRTCSATFVKDNDTAGPPPGATQMLTIAPVPTGGTLEGVDILCGSKGSICSANHPDGVAVELHPTADPDFTFMGFKGDCAPLGHTQMTGPRTCSATFSLTKEVSQPPPLKQQVAVARGRTGGGAPPPSPSPTPETPQPPVAPTPQPARVGRGPVVDPTQGTPKPVPAPISDEDFAKNKIQEMLKDYCAAEEALDPVAVQKIYPNVNMNALRQQLNTSKYRSVQCKFGDVVFVSLDPAAGKATVKAPLKRVYEHTILTEKPIANELTATLTLVRTGLRTQWQIEEAKYAPLAK